MINLLPTKHDVCGALEAVNDGLAAGVEVVVLGLDHRVIDIHCWNQQLVALAQLVESVEGELLKDKWGYEAMLSFTNI